jgi:hypothetical protein
MRLSRRAAWLVLVGACLAGALVAGLLSGSGGGNGRRAGATGAYR